MAPKRGEEKKSEPIKPRSQEMRDLLEAQATKLGYDYDDVHPVVWMQGIYLDEDQAIDVRVTCAKEVAGYIEPKRKAIEVTGRDGEAVKVEAKVNLAAEVIGLLTGGKFDFG